MPVFELFGRSTYHHSRTHAFSASGLRGLGLINFSFCLSPRHVLSSISSRAHLLGRPKLHSEHGGLAWAGTGAVGLMTPSSFSTKKVPEEPMENYASEQPLYSFYYKFSNPKNAYCSATEKDFYIFCEKGQNRPFGSI